MPVPAIFQVRSLETDELFDVDACNAHTLEERAGGETSQTGISRLLAHSRLNAEGELSDPNDAVRADARTQAKLVQKVLPIQGVRGSRGGGCSPDRTGLHGKFPANREKNREFCRIWPTRGDFRA
jgi:hypothetical protein